MDGGGGASFLEDVTLVEFMYLVFTRMSGGVTVGDSSLCCCVPCLLSSVASLRLMSLRRRRRPYMSFAVFWNNHHVI